MKTERLQKVLATLGLGSRREIERWISEGQITVNGKTAVLGEKVDGNEKIQVNGKLISLHQEAASIKVLIYNKPEGEICALRDPEGRPSVYKTLPDLAAGRWIMIGRLDINTTGLLLFTNDGELAHRLMHPSFEVEREYAVRVKGDVTPALLKQLLTGVELEDGFAKFDAIQDAGGTGLNHWYHVILREGRNREVRRLWESQNITVSRLIRVRFADVLLPRDLRRGEWEYLDKAGIVNLQNRVATKPVKK